MQGNWQQMDGYSVPQGIAVGQQIRQAVPRKTGAYDTEGIDTGAAVPSQLVFFQDSTAFGQANLALTKTYGRDTNLTSRTGGFSRGERCYAYGLSAKIGVGDVTLNSAANAVTWDQFRRIWGISDIEFKLGADEFITAQCRDVPVQVPQAPRHTFSDLVCPDISEPGMFDMTIGDEPYILDGLEDFRVNFNIRPQGLTTTLEWYITLRIHGVRIKSLHQ